MRKLLFVFMLCCLSLTASAQLEIREDLKSLVDNAYQTAPVRDYNNKPCALIIVKIPLDSVEFSGNVVGTPERKRDGYWVYVTGGTERLEIIPGGKYNPLDYVFPASIKDNGGVLGTNTYSLVIQPVVFEEREPLNKGIHVYLGGGYQLLGFRGPMANVGVNIGPLYAELNYVVGSNTMDKVAIYRNGSLYEAYDYKAKQSLSFLLGGMIDLDYLLLTPFAGYSVMSIEGSSINPSLNTTNFKKLEPAALTLGARVAFPIGKLMQVYATPVYALGLDNDEHFKVVCDGVSDMKTWTTGFQVSCGLLFRF